MNLRSNYISFLGVNIRTVFEVVQVAISNELLVRTFVVKVLRACTYGGVASRFSRIEGSGPSTGYRVYSGLDGLCQLYYCTSNRVNLHDRESRFSFSRKSDISFVRVREWVERSVHIINRPKIFNQIIFFI
jgi:hypothetical protein